MEKLRAQSLHADLCNIFQQEIKVLNKDIEALQMEKLDMMRYYEDLISDEREEKQALLLEIQELKDRLEKTEGKNHNQVSTVESTCPTVQELQQELKYMKNKYLDETQKLTIEFEIEVAVAHRELDKLCQELKEEKEMRAQTESEKLEAVEIAQTLLDKLEKMEIISKERASEVQDEDIPYLDIQQLQEMLQRERKLRVCAETENLDEFKIVEAFCEELEQELKKERELSAQTEAEKHEAVEIAQIVIHKLEEMEKTSKEHSAEVRWDDQDITQRDIQQLEVMLQKEKSLRIQAENENANLLKTVETFSGELQNEKALRAEAEKSKLDLRKICEKLFQRKTEARKITETLLIEKKMLANKLQKKEKKQQALLKDIQELTSMLDKEKALRLQAEDSEMEAVEIIETLEKEIGSLKYILSGERLLEERLPKRTCK
ncbi:hypothetical protein XENOCAPTIV_009129 [Xenoophorus captivus]|uniref:Uncharacterized protein n=1 Tax=Xenoophorus captivus TaxID=1517983 RepID=A0ABV0S8Z8_9TELE